MDLEDAPPDPTRQESILPSRMARSPATWTLRPIKETSSVELA
jgi:hypothetical protein